MYLEGSADCSGGVKCRRAGGSGRPDTGPRESNGAGVKMSDARHYFKGRSNRIF